jgi:DNA-binding IclR family transcriptional regulator
MAPSFDHPHPAAKRLGDQVLAALDAGSPADVSEIASRAGVRLTAALWTLRGLERQGLVQACEQRGARRTYRRTPQLAQTG